MNANTEGTRRSKNFTEYDKNLLSDIVKDYLHIVDNKKTDACNIKTKNETWNVITAKFNASSQTGPRSAKQVHALYDCMKKKARKNIADDRVEKYRTGGGTYVPKTDVIDEKIISILKPHMEPLSNPYDSSAEYLDISDTINKVPPQSTNTNTTLVEDKIDISAEIVLPEIAPSTATPEFERPISKIQSKRSPKEQSGSNFIKTKKRNLETLTSRIVERKDLKDKFDAEINNKKIKILDMEYQLKSKEYETKCLIYEKTKILLETELKIKKTEFAIKEIELLEKQNQAYQYE